MIKGERVILRPIDLNDTDKIIKWRNTEAVRKNFCNQEELTEETHINWINKKVITGETVQFIIIDKESGLEVGSTFIKDISKVHNKGEFGIFIGEDSARGKGLGYEATKLITDYGFDVLNLHKIYLRVFESNTGAIKAYERAGYIIEGTFEDDLYINGEYINLVFMAKFNREKN